MIAAASSRESAGSLSRWADGRATERGTELKAMPKPVAERYIFRDKRLVFSRIWRRVEISVLDFGERRCPNDEEVQKERVTRRKKG